MIVGLTGGIGSGKTTVAKIFEHLGVPVFEADAASKNLIDTDRELQGELEKLLGQEVVSDGKINRPYMASKIFSDKQLLRQTNKIIHPAVGREFKRWEKTVNAPYVIREAAILFESGSYQDCDKIVVVSAPREMRIERVMRRGNVSREQVLERMENQWPESKKLERADYVVQNDHTESLIKQVKSVHEDLIRQANEGSR